MAPIDDRLLCHKAAEPPVARPSVQSLYEAFECCPSDTIHSVPKVLTEQIVNSLSPAARRNLSAACRDFGQLPTNELITGIRLRLTESLPITNNNRVLEQQQSLVSARLPYAKTLKLTSRNVYDLLDAYIMPAQALQSLCLPSATCLTARELSDMPLRLMLSLAACLGSTLPREPAALTSLCLSSISDNRSLTSVRFSQLWAALEKLPSLRSLALHNIHFDKQASWLSGISRLERLESLHITDCEPQPVSLPTMGSLTQVIWCAG